MWQKHSKCYLIINTNKQKKKNNMKKIYYLIAMAFMALTFTSCEDVPAPFGQPIDPNVQVVVDPEGDGSKAKPFNVSAAVAECKKVGTTASTEKYYVKGKVKTDYTVGDRNSILVVLIDVENSTSEFTVYYCKRADGTGFDQGFKVNMGDEIVVYGPIQNYKGNTPETASGAYVVSINGEATGVEPASGGDSGSGGDTGGGSAVDMTKSTEGLVVTFTNANVTGSDKVTVDFSMLGLTSGSEIPEQTLANGTKISFAKNENTNAPKYYNDGVRMYAKNSMTIAGSKKIAKVVLNCITYTSSGNTINATGNEQMYGKADGNNVIINNDFTQASSGTQLRFKTMEITFEGEGSGGGTTPPATTAYFEESFANGKGNFTIEDKVFSSVWTAASYNSDKYMKATAFIKADGESANTKHDAENWLISPEFDIASATKPTLTFLQVINTYFGTVANEAMVFAKKEGGEWTKLTISYPTPPSGKYSKFTDDGAAQSVDLTAFKSSKTQIAFVYKGTSTACGTWEVKDVKVAEP